MADEEEAFEVAALEGVRPKLDVERMSDELELKEGSQRANTPVAMGHRILEETPADELHLELKARSQRKRRIVFSGARAQQTRPLAGLMSVDWDAAGTQVPQKIQ